MPLKEHEAQVLHRIARSLILVLGMAVGSVSAYASNIVSDPGFESGSFSSWNDQNGDWNVSSGLVHSGALAAVTGCVSAQCLDPVSGSSLYQDLSTDTEASYTFSFWYAPGGGTPNELDVRWDGNLVWTSADDPSGSTFQLVTLTELTASTFVTRIQFNGRQDPGALYLDDVCVSPAGDCSAPATVPEPATTFLIGSGLLALGLIGRRFTR